MSDVLFSIPVSQLSAKDNKYFVESRVIQYSASWLVQEEIQGWEIGFLEDLRRRPAKA